MRARDVHSYTLSALATLERGDYFVGLKEVADRDVGGRETNFHFVGEAV